MRWVLVISEKVDNELWNHNYSWGVGQSSWIAGLWVTVFLALPCNTFNNIVTSLRGRKFVGKEIQEHWSPTNIDDFIVIHTLKKLIFTVYKLFFKCNKKNVFRFSQTTVDRICHRWALLGHWKVYVIYNTFNPYKLNYNHKGIRLRVSHQYEYDNAYWKLQNYH